MVVYCGEGRSSGATKSHVTWCEIKSVRTFVCGCQQRKRDPRQGRKTDELSGLNASRGYLMECVLLHACFMPRRRRFDAMFGGEKVSSSPDRTSNRGLAEVGWALSGDWAGMQFCGG